MRSTMSVFSTTVALLAGVAVTGYAAAADMKLVQVQIFHRHGARGSIAPVNNTLVCGEAWECGQLNDFGKDMLVKLGTWLRDEYGSALQLAAGFNQFESYSRSTDLDRTMQSSAALLRGLYPDLQEYYPIVNTVNFDTDTLLLVDALMSYVIPDRSGMLPGPPLPDSLYTLIPKDVLRQMGRETFQDAICDVNPMNNTQYLTCGKAVQDITASWHAAGTLAAKAPTVVKDNNYEKLSELRRTINTQKFVYDPSYPAQKERGSLGFNLASTIVEKMNRTITSATPPSTVLYEWSAHDTTYMPLASALGQNTKEFMLPLFGASFVTELWNDTSVEGGSYFVKLRGAQPGQTPADHNITSSTLTAVGLTVEGKTIHSSPANPTIPFSDFARAVMATAPTSPRGDCYLSDAVLKAIQCEGHGTPTTPLCLQYRQRCPERSCPGTSLLNPDDLSCSAVDGGASSKDEDNGVSRGSVAVIATALLIGGWVSGAAAMYAVLYFRARRTKGYEASPDPEEVPQ